MDKVNSLRILVEDYYDVQDLRIRSANRVRSLKDSVPEKFLESYNENVLGKIGGAEDNIKKNILKELKNYQVWKDWMKNINGIGPCIAGGIIGWVNDIKRFSTISKFWMYCGYGQNCYCPECKKYTVAPGERELETKDGKKKIKIKVFARMEKCNVCGAKTETRIQKLMAGCQLNWNPRLKTQLWKLGESFVKTGKSYRKLYDKLRKDYDKRFQNESDGHRYAMAKRKTVQIFLSQLMQKWYELEGEEAPVPYIHAVKGHTNIIQPDEMLDK